MAQQAAKDKNPHVTNEGLRTLQEDLTQMQQNLLNQLPATGQTHEFGNQQQPVFVWPQPERARHVINMEFPKFNEGDDPGNWLFRCEQFFKFDRTHDEKKIPLAVLHKHNAALNWFQYFEKMKGTEPSWEEFAEALNVRFGSFEDPIGEFVRLRQTGTVMEYQAEFERLAVRVNGLSKEMYVGVFVSGLKAELNAEVRVFSPPDVTEAVRLARLLEQKLEYLANRHLEEDEDEREP